MREGPKIVSNVVIADFGMYMGILNSREPCESFLTVHCTREPLNIEVVTLPVVGVNNNSSVWAEYRQASNPSCE